MSVKYICPNCHADMQQNREEEITEGNRVVEPHHMIFQCTNPLCGYTCNESALIKLETAREWVSNDGP